LGTKARRLEGQVSSKRITEKHVRLSFCWFPNWRLTQLEQTSLWRNFLLFSMVKIKGNEVTSLTATTLLTQWEHLGLCLVASYRRS
jgi:hypothetical protein